MWSKHSASHINRMLLVAVAGVGSLAFIPRAGAGDQASPAATNQPADQYALRLPDGFVQKDEDAVSGVRSTVVGLTERAVTKDSYDSFFNGFLSELAQRDKDHAREFKGVDQNHLNDLIGQIQTEWRGKYNQDFDISDKNLVFDDSFPIAQGEVSDTSTASNNWPMPAVASQAGTPVGTDQVQSNTKELTTGRAVAVMQFPAGDGMPEMNVSFIHQLLTGWYVDVPVDRTGEQIYNDITSHLQYIASHQDQWPSDVNSGYHMVARHIIAALYGVPSNGATASAQ
ncbi:MAG TPA: hypothetical protein VL992_09680 [Tepidisphaeraceae bacterium]|nr:hypothetical protein [Tepidisphaeraceae bacterium]